MRQLKITAISAIVLLCCTGSSLAATPADFYVDLLQKGIAEYNAENYGQAAGLLRVAAFGLLEFTDRYQTAEVYRTIAADKVKDSGSVRDAARRVVAAERVQRTYAALTLPVAVRSLFEDVAKKVLAAGDIALLKSTSTSTPPQTTQPQTTPPPRTTTVSKNTNPPATQQTTPAKPEQKPEVKPAEVKPVETKPAETKPAQIKPVETKPAQIKPVQVKPDPKPVVETPRTQTTTTKPVETKPAQTSAKPAPTPTTTTPAPAPQLAQQLAAAERALGSGNLTEARRIYRLVIDGALTHDQAIRVAEGLYRARDFANVLRAFEHAGALRRGEEPYRFYLAVALYETGKYAAAKKELAAALNYIEITPDVARYREMIESAVD